MKILVTGGAGYIGSQCVRLLAREGHTPVVLDDFSEGHAQAIEGFDVVTADLKKPGEVRTAFENFSFDAVFHFAARCYVGESVEDPEAYYANNVTGLLNLLRLQREFGVRRLVFSSSCAVYGIPPRVPITEDAPFAPVSPYGRTKRMGEEILADAARAYGLAYVALRYFNASGADPNGWHGEDHDPETHLIPRVLRVAQGLEPHVSIFGTDYPTADGTCIRDYVHVEDIARAHVLAIDLLEEGRSGAFNLGNGSGYSVRQVIDVAREVTGCPIAVREEPRRPGDPPALFSDSTAIRERLDWEPRISELRDIIGTAWRWHRTHPRGYGEMDSILAQREATSAELFGEVAIRLGFVREKDVIRALAIQKDLLERGEKHKLIGLIMLEQGMITNAQLIEILRYYERAGRGAR
ncbi:MAG: UDP-glucose 4-epimerase GalE [Planctomycetes bacterium]|nr:UDP-glucose 4-epimerase GalE [Planctomycetota bacterium]